MLFHREFGTFEYQVVSVTLSVRTKNAKGFSPLSVQCLTFKLETVMQI